MFVLDFVHYLVFLMLLLVFDYFKSVSLFVVMSVGLMQYNVIIVLQ